ncbi:MAG: polyprenol monophosphomannose synthase [Elusimicrobia bacterium]|nr:polyprenol monophosphomannose synthase [Candidatus Liberimonas magnetica]
MDIVVVIPTYNESGNIGQLIKEILDIPLEIEILVVDDFSPDKTYQTVESLSNENKRVHLLLRKENRGRGWAGIDGFKKALGMGANLIVEMDADFSHPPRFIRSFKEKIKDADIVIGSRYVKEGKDEKRTALRRLISAFARNYLSMVLGINICDPTSGFRMFKKEALLKILPHLKAGDPFIVTEVLFYAKKYNLRLLEVPIEFMPRLSGESKLKTSTLLKYLFRVWKLKLLS